MSSELQLDVRCLSWCGGDIWWTLTKERQVWCYLQVKLCDPCLSALSVPPWPKKRYINTLPFLHLFQRYLSAIPMVKVRDRVRVSRVRFRVSVSGPSEWRTAIVPAYISIESLGPINYSAVTFPNCLGLNALQTFWFSVSTQFFTTALLVRCQGLSGVLAENIL